MRSSHHPSPQELLQRVLSQPAETQQMPYKEQAKWPIRQAVLDLAQVLKRALEGARCLCVSFRGKIIWL